MCNKQIGLCLSLYIQSLALIKPSPSFSFLLISLSSTAFLTYHEASGHSGGRPTGGRAEEIISTSFHVPPAWQMSTPRPPSIPSPLIPLSFHRLLRVHPIHLLIHECAGIHNNPFKKICPPTLEDLRLEGCSCGTFMRSTCYKVTFHKRRTQGNHFRTFPFTEKA